MKRLTPRRQERLALAFFAVANIKPDTPWSAAAVHGDGSEWRVTTREIIQFENTHWEQTISSGSYDDIRRVDLAALVLAGIVLARAGKPNASTNDPTRRYAVAPEVADLLKAIGTPAEEQLQRQLIAHLGSFEERLEKHRPKRVDAKLPDGRLLQLSSGSHNVLQKAVLEEFLPRFTQDPVVLYLGDTAKKALHVEDQLLAELGFEELAHDRLPDIIVLDKGRNWILLIEAVHSSNPISKERHLILETFTANCPVPKVYVSVFANRQEFRKWVCDISWETEVWLVESPDHMIHFNGDKFLGPYA
jgi:type II restriction enzyme